MARGRISKALTAALKNRKLKATVVAQQWDTVTVEIPGRGRLHGVRVVGSIPVLGTTVWVNWDDHEPYIMTAVTSGTPGASISYSSAPNNTGSTPGTDPFTAAGWVTDESGVIYNADTYKCEIHPDGTIKLGGSTGIILDPAIPEIKMGSATNFLTGAGVWMGYHSGVYKMHIGDPAIEEYMSWDGSTLTVKGYIVGESEIGSTIADTFTINADDTNTTVKLIMARSTGGDAELQWNGSTVSLYHSGSNQWTVTGDGDMQIYDRLGVGIAPATQYALRVYSNDYSIGSYAHATSISYDWTHYDTHYTALMLNSINLVTTQNISRTQYGYTHRYNHNTSYNITGTIYGYYSEIYFENNPSTGIVNSYIHFAAAGTYKPYGTLNNTTGFYVQDSLASNNQYAYYAVDLTSATNNYFLYGNRGKSRLGDQLTISGWQDVIQLDVYGNASQGNPIVRIYGNSQQLRINYDGDDYATFTVASDGSLAIATISSGSGGNLNLNPEGDVVLNPSGYDVLPGAHYTINLGSQTTKYKNLYASQLLVDTLVAQDVKATIGGRILVGPTSTLTSDLGNTNLVLNNGMETAGTGGSDIWANWTENVGNGTLVRDSAVKYSGTYSAKITAGSSLNTYIYQLISVSSDTTYTLMFYARGDGLNDPRYAVWDTTNSSWITTTTNTDITSTSFTQYNAYFTTPGNCTSIRIYLYCGDTNGAVVYFDEIYLVASSIYTEHNNFVTGDYLYMEKSGSTEWFKVQGSPIGSGPYKYPVSRGLGGVFNTWAKGDSIFDTGSLGDGWIDIYSNSGVLSGVGPTIVGNRRPSIGSLPDYGWINSVNYSPAWAIGNLDGLYSVGTTTMGVALGDPDDINVLITATDGFNMRKGTNSISQWTTAGVIRLGDSTTEHIQIASTYLKIFDTSGYERIALDSTGLTIRDSSGNAVITLDSSGNADITRKLRLPETTSAISIGNPPPTSSSAGTGVWIDRTGFYGLNSNTQQVIIDATDGAIYAGGSDKTVILNNDGITLKSSAIGYSKKYSIDFGTTLLYGTIYTYQGGGAGNFFYFDSYDAHMQLTSQTNGNSSAAKVTIMAYDADNSPYNQAYLYIEATTTTKIVKADATQFIYTNTLYKNTIDLHPYHGFTTKLSHTSWDGDSKTVAGSPYTVSLTSGWTGSATGIPSNCHTVWLRVRCSSSTAGATIGVGNGTDAWQLSQAVQNTSQPINISGPVNLTNDNIYVNIQTGSMDVYIWIIGYSV